MASKAALIASWVGCLPTRAKISRATVSFEYSATLSPWKPWPSKTPANMPDASFLWIIRSWLPA